MWSLAGISSEPCRPMPDYRYELRRGDEMIATGHFSREEPLDAGERVAISSYTGIVRAIEPQPPDPGGGDASAKSGSWPCPALPHLPVRHMGHSPDPAFPCAIAAQNGQVA